MGEFGSIFEDVRFALRQLRRAPVYTVIAVAVLAGSLGATLAMGCLVEEVLLRPLPYTAPNRLVGVSWANPREKPNATQTGATADYLLRRSHSFSSAAVFDDGTSSSNLAWTSGGAVQSAVVVAERVSQPFFRTLGATPVLGRTFTAEEDRRGGPPAVVLSYALWQRSFGGNRAVVGRSLRLDGELRTIVGVMGPGLRLSAQSSMGVGSTPELWIPLALSPQDPGYDGDNYAMVARLRPGVTLAQLRAELSSFDGQFLNEHPQYKNWTNREGESPRFRAWPFQQVVSAAMRGSLLTLLGAAAAVLLLGALNLAGLNVARAVRRQRELALRATLGAGRAGLLRLLLAESVCVALPSAALGAYLARAAVPLLLRWSPVEIPVLGAEVGWPWLLDVAMVLSLGAVLLFGLLPAALVLQQANAGEALKASPAAGVSRGEARLGHTLVVLQVGLATTLLLAASLLLGTFVKLRATPLGLDPAKLLIAQVTLKGDAYATAAATHRLLAAVEEQLAHVPGVEGVAAISGLPLDRGLNEGAHPIGQPRTGVTEVRAVEPGYFAVAGIPVVQGRALAASDRAGAQPVLVISQTAARRWWPGGSALGAMVDVGGDRVYRVVGVVGDTRGAAIAAPPDVTLYVPFAQMSDVNMHMMNGWITTSIVVRTRRAAEPLASPIEAAVHHADPELPLSRLSSMESFVDASVGAPRFFATLAGLFAGFGLLLALLGVFGLLSYQVAARTREIGVRMALGADRVRMVESVLARGLVLTGVGLALGLGSASVVERGVESILSDVLDTGGAPTVTVLPSTAATSGAAAVLLLLAAGLACWVPARRAAAVEPAEALRAE